MRAAAGPRSARAALLAAVTALLALLLAGPAAAAAPLAGTAPARLATQLQDTAGVLDADGTARVQGAVDELYDNARVRLWVVLVASFDGVDRETWADRTRSLSDLGDRDVVLAVATGDRAYLLDAPTALSEVSDDELAALRTDAVEPALRQQDWAGAAVATAGGLGAAATSTGSGSGASLLGVAAVAVLLLVVLGGALLWARRRRGRREADELAAALRVDGTDRAALAGVGTAALRARAEQVVTETDEAVRTSREELALATDELGALATARFADALAEAEHAMARAFATRQVLDDAVPETEEQTREMLVELVVGASTADRVLDEQAEQFRAARDLLGTGPEHLDALTRGLVAARVRVQAATAAEAELRERFPAGALAPVAGNVALATEHLELVGRAIEDGRAAAARPVGEQGPLVDAVRTAEAALAQTTALLDAVDHAGTDIPHAVATLPAAVADAEAGVAQARALAAQRAPAAARPGPELAEALAAAEAALGRARERGASDPLGSLGEVAAADAELDRAFAAASGALAAAERSARALTDDLAAAGAQVGAAADFVATRRGGVGAQARTRLAEAQRRLAEAQRLAPEDPSTALGHARAAAQLGAQALAAAQADVDVLTRGRPGGGGSGAGQVAGAVLGGILVQGLLGGGRGRGGGFGGGGLGPGGGGPRSFGGAGGGRVGGGRF